MLSGSVLNSYSSNVWIKDIQLLLYVFEFNVYVQIINITFVHFMFLKPNNIYLNKT